MNVKFLGAVAHVIVQKLLLDVVSGLPNTAWSSLSPYGSEPVIWGDLRERRMSIDPSRGIVERLTPLDMVRHPMRIALERSAGTARIPARPMP